MRIDVIHGPNLRLLGRREPDVYGSTSLENVDRALRELAGELGVELEIHQSNHEGELLDVIEAAADGGTRGFVVNAGGFTHTSVALRDALVGVDRPFVEVHVSNTAARERFRQRSLLAPVAVGVVFGFGASGYLLGLRGLAERLAAG